jgi:putative spermidine/putrescine transport system permease protein
VLSALQLCFVLAMSAYVSPALLGGGRVLVLPQMILRNLIELNWPMAAVQSIVLLSFVLGVVLVTNWFSRRIYEG